MTIQEIINGVASIEYAVIVLLTTIVACGFELTSAKLISNKCTKRKCYKSFRKVWMRRNCSKNCEIMVFKQE